MNNIILIILDKKNPENKSELAEKVYYTATENNNNKILNRPSIDEAPHLIYGNGPSLKNRLDRISW